MLRGNRPGSPLYDYFVDKLPEGLSPANYRKGLSCYGFARLIAIEFGGKNEARIFRVEKEDLEHPGDPEFVMSHAYVIPVGANDTDPAYNNDTRVVVTVQEVKENGTDVTDEIFSEPWDRL